MNVFNYKIVSISDRKSNELPRVKKTNLEPIEQIKQLSKELYSFLENRNDAEVEINDIECSLKVTTTQSETDVDVAVKNCISNLDLEHAKK